MSIARMGTSSARIPGLRDHRIVTVGLNPTIDRIMEVPGFRVGEHHIGRLRQRTAAGKAFNVSRVLAFLGVPNGAFGWVGQESMGLFQEAAAAAGVAACFTPIAGTTRENITVLDPLAHTETHIRDRGPTVTDAEIDQLEQVLCCQAAARHLLVFTGSLATGLSPTRFAGILSACAAAGATVIVDTSGEALSAAVRQPVWMIKPNVQELGELVGGPIESDARIVEAGTRLNERIPLVVITMGRRGAMCFHGGRIWHAWVELPAERIRSTVGCGDAFLGGFLAELIRSDGFLEAALSRAAAVSAASALCELPATFRMEDLEQLSSRVILRSIR